MDPTPADRCRSCGTPITWRLHPRTGKAAPIEEAASPTGTIELLRNGHYRIVPAAERATFRGPLHTNHFATCPQASQWHRTPEVGHAP